MSAPTLAPRTQPASATLAGSVADPGPLGLAAFAVTTFILSAFNAGLLDIGVETVVFGSALLYGGAVQVLAGMWEFVKGNTFGATAFSSYGGFWMSFWGIHAFFTPAQGTTPTDADHAIGLFLLAWTIFTGIMLIASLRTNRILPVVFVALFITFALLTAGKFTGSATLSTLGGWTGLVTAGLAFYACAAGVINTTWKRTVLPA